jgi:hypothetical protein
MKLKDFFLGLIISINNLFKKSTKKVFCVKKILLAFIFILVLISNISSVSAYDSEITNYSFTGLIHSDIGIMSIVSFIFLLSCFSLFLYKKYDKKFLKGLGVVLISSTLISGVTLIDFFDQPINIYHEVNVNKNINIKDVNYRNFLRSNNHTTKFNNINKIYREKNKNLVFEDNKFDIVLLNISLESNFIENVLPGNDVKIAWFSLHKYDNKLFDNILFYDINNNYSIINKSFKLKYFDGYNNCSGLQFCLYENWVEFDSVKDLNKLKNNKIIIGIFTDIKSGDYIEWIIERDNIKVFEWAIVAGVNHGFVSSSPSTDPEASVNLDFAGKAIAINSTSPIGAVTVSEIGWYLGLTFSCSGSIDYEVGIYTGNGTDPTTRLNVSTGNTFTCGGSTGWQKVTGLDWSISENTEYWIAIQSDFDEYYFMDTANSGGYMTWKNSQSSLPSSWGSSDTKNNAFPALYVVYTSDIVLEADINVTYSNIVSRIVYRVNWGTDLTAYDVEPENQTDLIGVFNITNNGTADGNLTIKWNETYTNVYTEASCNNFTSNYLNLTTSDQTICRLNDSDQTYVWLRRDYLGIPTKKNIGILFNITTIS